MPFLRAAAGDRGHLCQRTGKPFEAWRSPLGADFRPAPGEAKDGIQVSIVGEGSQNIDVAKGKLIMVKEIQLI